MRGATGWWTAVGWAVGRLGGWAPKRWTSDGGQQILVVAPHPDDELGCGGAVLLHQRMGDHTHAVYVTDGRGSRAGGLHPEEMAAQRRAEVEAVAPILGFEDGRWLGLREWEWENAALESALCEALRQTRPQLVYAPSCVDFHPEHVRVAACLGRALAAVGAPDVVVRAYQVQVPLTPVLANLIATVGSVWNDVIAAAGRYRTQLGSIERCLRMKRYAGAYYGISGPVEEFWELDSHSYVHIHATNAIHVSDSAFRGVRRWPLTDPLAYLQGLRVRRYLRTTARPVWGGGV